MTSMQNEQFGHIFRKHFLFAPKYTSLNHGSFGTYPINVYNVLQHYRRLCEEAPDKFLRYTYTDLLDKSREEIAKFLNAPADECVFVQNATSGVNTILRNLHYKEKDCIIYFNTVYGALEKTLNSIVEYTPELQLRKVQYRLPCTHSEILDALSATISQALQDGLTPKLCLFETIASVPGFRLPFERITEICKAQGILSLIDGAHGVGQIPLDMSVLSPDFFVSNCHKWLYTPRGCAVLHIPKRNQHLMRTTFPTSWGWLPIETSSPQGSLTNAEKSHFVNLFAYVGTSDSAPYYCVPAALEFRRTTGGGNEAIFSYIRDIAQRGADLVASLLGTEVMDDKPDREPNNWSGGLRDCALANVLLPISVLRAVDVGKLSIAASNKPEQPEGLACVEESDLITHAIWMTRTFIEEYHVGVTIFPYDSKLWIRVSGQIFLELKDFEMLANLLKVVIARLKTGESLGRSSKV